MRGFHEGAFLDLFKEVERITAVSPAVDRWETDGVLWVSERHLSWGERYSFQIQAHEPTRTAARSWVLLVMIETWWGRVRDKAIRAAHWGRLDHDRKEDACAGSKPLGPCAERVSCDSPDRNSAGESP